MLHVWLAVAQMGLPQSGPHSPVSYVLCHISCGQTIQAHILCITDLSVSPSSLPFVTLFIFLWFLQTANVCLIVVVYFCRERIELKLAGVYGDSCTDFSLATKRQMVGLLPGQARQGFVCTNSMRFSE